ncbi:DNA recombination protein RmuC [Nocardia sp. 852002-20019_SCH5090214]|uniref:DNA recombination protein RmuC n=1 Tax=Nocardia sp. 852002-20019_SCH5090214 TaxID=1834087 RepID=UPI000B114F5D|nr:DNA recombination protein RmuC [Nocardia sp. 852002-20019_SCH5090214]
MISSIAFTIVVVIVAVLAAGAGYMVSRGGPDGAEERARHEHQQAERARSERDTAVAQVQALQQQLQEAATVRGGLQAQLDGERQKYADQLDLLRGAQEEMQDTVRQMAGEVLAQSGSQLIQRFTEMTDHRAKATAGEMDQRKSAIEAMVTPLRQELDKLYTKVQTFHESGIGAFSAVAEQVKMANNTSERLRKETEQLVTALRKPGVRGQWGELQLRTLVEAAGMVEHVDFEQQVHVVTDGDSKNVRPDMVINLGGGKTIVVDAKAPFGAFLDAQDADDEAARQERVAAHARNVRRHVEQLAGKQYWAQFARTPEFVVMFLPADAFLHAALDHDPGLWDHAIRSKIIIATPTNLLMSLRTVAYMWQRHTQSVNAEEIAKLGRELYGRIATMADHLNAMGASLGKAVDNFNKTVGSFEGRVIPGARKIAELRGDDPALKDLAPVERSVRALTFPSTAGPAPDGDTGVA